MTGAETTHLECVVNVSEGRDLARLEALDASCGQLLVDRHTDADHHRSVFTLAGPGPEVEAATRRLARAAVERLDLGGHSGVHPRLGVLDVVPFVDLDPGGTARPGPAVGPGAIGARERFLTWAGDQLALPGFRYGPLGPGRGGRTLPEVRRGAFTTLAPDAGPPGPHPSAGAVAVGARGVLVAYNVWVAGGSRGLARGVAAAVRGPAVRALGLAVDGRWQVSCNLIDPWVLGPAEVYDRIAGLLGAQGASAAGGELVGLLPQAVLAGIPTGRLAELGITTADSIEARVSARAR